MWKSEYNETRKHKYATDASYRDKSRSTCRTPEKNREYMRAYYAANKHRWPKKTPEQRSKHNAARRQKYQECPERRMQAIEDAKKWSANNPAKRKEQRLRQYGLTRAQYEDMLQRQRGLCAICGFSDTSDAKTFPLVDHCHSTGQVRGILCSACNHGIGKFKDDVGLLRKAIDYLTAAAADAAQDLFNKAS